MQVFKTIIACLLVSLAYGCGSSAPPAATTSHDDHDHHAEGHAETLPQAIDAIAEMRAAIVEAFKSGKPEDAHHDLHEIFHVIEQLPELRKKASLSSEADKKVAESAEKLVVAFGALDKSLHGSEGKSVDDVESEIDLCLKELKSVIPQ